VLQEIGDKMSNISLSNRTIALIVPCFNEQEVLPETAKQLFNKLQNLILNNIVSKESKIVFIDDGSNDKTWQLIENLYTDNPQYYAGIKMSRNKGHQNALLCGLLSMKDFVDAVISIDADLQDDINVIDEMVEKYNLGCEIVYGIRSNRNKDSFLKKITAEGFYKLMRFLGADVVFNHADFRLMGKNALFALSEYREVNLFLRGIVPILGYKTGYVYYSRKERLAGTTKYPLRKMLNFAFEGITSFSTRLIRYITKLGILIFIVSLAISGYFIYQYFKGVTVLGWASIVVSIWGIGGLTIFSIGIVGEYIGKIYLETKGRPRFHIEQFLYERKEKYHSTEGL
jgi:glycosyltransferase involved in cell wall biosynthesis